MKMGHPNNPGEWHLSYNPQGRIVGRQKVSRVVVGYMESANQFLLEILVGKKILKDGPKF